MYAFVRWLLVVTVSVSILWPLNIPLAALAFKVRNGQRPMPLESGAYWTRSTFAGLGMAVLAGVAVLLDWFLARSGIPPGVVHVVVVLLYAPVAVWFLFWIFALDEMLEGVSLLLLFVFLPGLPLALLHLLGLHVLVADAWLAPIT